MTAVVVGTGVWAGAAPARHGDAADRTGAAFQQPAALDELTDIEVTALPERTEYLIGSRFDERGLQITGSTGNGQEQELASDEYRLNGFESNTPGEKTVTVELAGNEDVNTSFAVTVEDVELPSRNLLENGSFETGSSDPWVVTYARGTGENQVGDNSNGVSSENGRDGTHSFNFWDRNNKTSARVEQTLVDLPRGYYTVSGYAAGNDGDGTAGLTVDEIDWSESFTLSGGGNWDLATTDFEWPGGDLTVAFEVDMDVAGGWAAFDDLRLIRTAPDEHVEAITVATTHDEYTVGQQLDESTLSVRKVMADGTTFAVGRSEWSVGSHDPNRVGTQPVTVTWESDPAKTATVDITWHEREAVETDITSLQVAAEPWRPVLKTGRTLSRQGLVVTGATAAGDTRVLTADEYELRGFDPAAVGSQDVRVVLTADPAITTTITVDVVAEPAAGVYEITDVGRDSADGVVSSDGTHATVALEEVPAGNGTVVLRRGALTTPLESLTFTRATGDVLDLVVEDWALSQQGHPSLQTVTFPEGLDTLTIGDSAFYQYSATGGAALTDVHFPTELWRLDIDRHAFGQDVRTRAALATVTFPQKLAELTVGERSFRQKYGEAGGLESVNLPAGLADLTIDDLAFSLSPSYQAGESLRSIYLGFDATGAPSGTARIGAGATDTGSPLHEDRSAWLWQGDDSVVRSVFGTRLVADEPTSATRVRGGYALTFDPNTDGSLYPATALPSNTGLVPVATSEGTSWEQSIATLTPRRTGYRFVGWVSEDGTSYAPGDRVRGAGESVHLVAEWEAEEATVRYEPNGGEGTVEAYSATTDATFVVADGEGIERPGHRFAGWTTDPEGDGRSYEPQTRHPLPAGELVLYAQWIAVDDGTDPGESESPTDPGESESPTDPEGPTETEPTGDAGAGGDDSAGEHESPDQGTSPNEAGESPLPSTGVAVSAIAMLALVIAAAGLTLRRRSMRLRATHSS